MKSVLFTGILLVATLAQARTVTCKQTAKDIHNSDIFEDTFTLDIPSKNAKKIVAKVTAKDGTFKKYEVEFDDHDSLDDSEKDEEGYISYHLDEDYDSTKEVRFITPESDLAGSDGDSIIFIDKTVMNGQAGSVSLSSGQPNDGDGGTSWIWGRVYIFSCK